MTSKTKRDLQHHQMMVTQKQSLRMASGRMESVPGDYQTQGTVSDAWRLKAMHEAEDRRMQKELDALNGYGG